MAVPMGFCLKPANSKSRQMPSIRQDAPGRGTAESSWYLEPYHYLGTTILVLAYWTGCTEKLWMRCSMFYESWHNSGEEAMEFREERDAATAFMKQLRSEIFILESPIILIILEWSLVHRVIEVRHPRVGVLSTQMVSIGCRWPVCKRGDCNLFENLLIRWLSTLFPSVCLTFKSTPVQRSNRKYPAKLCKCHTPEGWTVLQNWTWKSGDACALAPAALT